MRTKTISSQISINGLFKKFIYTKPLFLRKVNALHKNNKDKLPFK